MRRYRFALETVLRVRRSEQDAARGRLVAATQALAAQEQLLVQTSAAYETACVGPDQLACSAFLQRQYTRSAYAAVVLAQREQVGAAQDGTRAARAAWSVAASRVHALERLDERQRAEHRARSLAQDELAADELVVSRHGRSDR